MSTLWAMLASWIVGQPPPASAWEGAYWHTTFKQHTNMINDNNNLNLSYFITSKFQNQYNHIHFAEKTSWKVLFADLLREKNIVPSLKKYGW